MYILYLTATDKRNDVLVFMHVSMWHIVYAYVYAYMYPYMYVYVYVYAYACVYVCTCICVYAYVSIQRVTWWFNIVWF